MGDKLVPSRWRITKSRVGAKGRRRPEVGRKLAIGCGMALAHRLVLAISGVEVGGQQLLGLLASGRT